MTLRRLFLVTAATLGAAAPFGARAGAQVKATELPGPNLPTTGRSLFDHLTVTDDGTGFDIPFPIEALVAKLRAKTGVAPKVTMIPKGRSLQRDHADFASPRLVMAFDDVATPPAGDLGVLARDRLYLGYAERGEQVEVISYNAAAGRYEFQLVKDYKAGAKPRLVYNNRAFCVRCHHNGAPIFSPHPWAETTGVFQKDRKVADLVLNARAGAATFHGFEVAHPRQISYDIDNSTKRADVVMPYQRLWMDGCGRDAADAARCRGLALRFALEMEFRSPPAFSSASPEYASLAAMWKTHWPEQLAGGMIVPQSTLPHYDPLTMTGTNAGFPDLSPGLTPVELAHLNQLLQTTTIPDAVDPLRHPLGALETWSLSEICYGDCLIYGLRSMLTPADKVLLKAASGKDFAKVAAAIDALIDDSASGALANRPFRRGVVMRALLAKLGATAPAMGGADDDAPLMPARLLNPDDTTEGGGVLSLMQRYCAPCHQQFPGLKFLAGTATEIQTRFKANNGRLGKEALLRLDWEHPTDGHEPMPPELDAPETWADLKLHPDDRQAIQAWVKSALAN